MHDTVPDGFNLGQFFEDAERGIRRGLDFRLQSFKKEIFRYSKANRGGPLT